MKQVNTYRHAIITQWLTARQQLLSAYWEVSGIGDHHMPTAADPRLALQHFSELLIDYTAAVHFRWLPLLLDKKLLDNTTGSIHYAIQPWYERLLDTTDIIAGYDTATFTDEQLSQVGEVLAKRLDIEDMIMTLTASTRRYPLRASA